MLAFIKNIVQIVNKVQEALNKFILDCSRPLVSRRGSNTARLRSLNVFVGIELNPHA